MQKGWKSDVSSFEGLCTDLGSIALPALLSLYLEPLHSMCTSGRVNSPGKLGSSNHQMVCVVCSVSSWDSVLVGYAPALGLALKGTKICLPRACSLGQTSELAMGH